MNLNNAAADKALPGVRSCLTRECLLLNPPADANFKSVLKRGTVPVTEGGLTSRLSLLFDILPRVIYHA